MLFCSTLCPQLEGLRFLKKPFKLQSCWNTVQARFAALGTVASNVGSVRQHIFCGKEHVQFSVGLKSWADKPCHVSARNVLLFVSNLLGVRCTTDHLQNTMFLYDVAVMCSLVMGVAFTLGVWAHFL